MIEKLKFGSSLCLGLLLLNACTVETVDSKNIRTGGIVALITANATTDATTNVTARLKVGGTESNTYVDLSGGDRIFATANTTRLEMEAQGTGEYQIDFDMAAADTSFTVDLQREAETDTDAPKSQGLLPGPFSMVVPNMTSSRATDITITWAPADTKDDMTLDLSGTCIFNRTIYIPGDTGSHTITGGTLVSVNTDKPETCDINVEMKRSRKGTPDTAFDPQSSFVLTQTRTAKFTSAP